MAAPPPSGPLALWAGSLALEDGARPHMPVPGASSARAVSSAMPRRGPERLLTGPSTSNRRLASDLQGLLRQMRISWPRLSDQ